MIALFEIPLSEWTELEVVVETIKLWSFLAKDGMRTKSDYFCSSYNPILSACFLCEYYFNYLNKKETGTNKFTSKKVCRFFNCCLKSNSICGFNYNGSAFNIWYESDDRQTREKAAKKIVQAAKRRYKILTGEKYHE